MDSHTETTRPHADFNPDIEEKKVGGSGSPGLMGGSDDLRNADGSSIQGGEDVLALQDLDPALNLKMHLVNNVSDNRSTGEAKSACSDTAFARIPPVFFSAIIPSYLQC